MDIEDLLVIADNHPGAGNHKLAAAIIKKGKVLGIGVNQYKTHPLQKQFSKDNKSLCLHAEIDAIRNSLRRNTVDDLIGSTLIVARIKKNGTKGNATPCPGCQRAIINFGIKEVIHT